jgi:hypothetical protein
VARLRRGAFYKGRTRQEFMDDLAKRARIWNRTRVDTSSPNAFVRDLIRTRVLEVENERG